MSILPLLTPTGIPRAGLVAWHDLYFPNLAYYSESPASWVGYKSGTGTDAVITGGQTDPNDGSTAVRLQMDAGAGETSSDYCHVALSTYGVWSGSEICTFGFWAKANNGTATDLRCLLGGQTLSLEPTIPASGEWVFVSNSRVPVSNSYLGIKVWGVAGSRVADVTVWHPQFYPCASAATLPPYTATTDLQTAESGLIDLSGNGNRLSRGSNASAADTNDPTVLGPGLRFVTDDYALTPTLTGGLTLAGPLTAVLVGKFTATTDSHYLALGQSAVATERQGIVATVGSAGSVKSYTRSTLGLYALSSSLTVGTNPVMLALTAVSSGNVTVTLLPSGSAQSVANKQPLTGIDTRLVLGANAQTVFPVDSATLYEDLLYNRVLTSAELQRIRRAVKAKWAARGVDIV